MGSLRVEQEILGLPHGLKFCPADEEIITYYLTPKVLDRNFSAIAIGEVDINKFEPWELPGRAKMGEEWYFYCKKERKYPTGLRTNRATNAGYWKATGRDKEIYTGWGVLVGMKKTLVFYKGRAPSGEKTNWVMREYRLEGNLPNLQNSNRFFMDDWVVCKIINNGLGTKKANPISWIIERSTSTGGEFLVHSTALPPLANPPDNAATGTSTSVQAPPSSYLAALTRLQTSQDMNMSQFGNPMTAVAPPAFYQPVGGGTWNFQYLDGPEEQGAPVALTALASSDQLQQDYCMAEQHSNCAYQNAVVEVSSAVPSCFDAVPSCFDDQLGGLSASSASVDFDGWWKY